MAPKQTFIPVVLISILTCMIFGCAGMNPGGYNQNGVYNSGYSHNDDYYYQREQDRLRDEHYRLKDERRDLQRERERIARQKEALQRERERQQQKAHAKPKRETCPSGWRPGRCADRDRKHGCKDMRTSGGLGCRTN